jgi:serine/threonine protein kinase
MSGTVLGGRYRLVRLIARGGMGAVYVGEHLLLHGHFAVKILGPQYSHDGEHVARFLQEARAASQIRHPNIVQITDFGRDGDTVFMVMELLPGQDLAQLIGPRGEGRPLAWSRLAPMVLQICSALQAAHDAGLVHRDVKPSNCVCTTLADGADFIKVVDFGIAKALERTSLVDDDGERPRTDTGMWLGTPDYMAPEIFRGVPPDPRADVYAVGILMYKLLTGVTPFAGVRPEQLPALDRSRPRAPGSLRSLPPMVDEVVLRAIAADPDQRYASATELAQAVAACQHSREVEDDDTLVRSRAATPPRHDLPTLQHAGRGASQPVTTVSRRTRRAWVATSVIVASMVAVVVWAVGTVPEHQAVATTPSAVSPEAPPAISLPARRDPSPAKSPSGPLAPRPADMVPARDVSGSADTPPDRDASGPADTAPDRDAPGPVEAALELQSAVKSAPHLGSAATMSPPTPHVLPDAPDLARALRPHQRTLQNCLLKGDPRPYNLERLTVTVDMRGNVEILEEKDYRALNLAVEICVVDILRRLKPGGSRKGGRYEIRGAEGRTFTAAPQ